MSIFEFEIGDSVRLKKSKEEGEVTGRAEYAYGEPAYNVFYCPNGATQTSVWINQSHLEFA